VYVFQTLSTLLTAFLLYLLFRRVSGVVLPLVVVYASLVASLGIMVWIGIPMSVTLQILPAFLTFVGVCDALHILVIVNQQMARGARKEAAIPFALGHSGLAVVMTSMTTAAGLLSFVLADVAPVAQLGVIAPIGIMLALVYSLTLLPALLAVIPLKPVAVGDARARSGWTDRFLTWSGEVSTTHPWQILAVTALILLACVGGVCQVRFSHHMMRWFPETEPLRIATEIISREFKGATTAEVLIDTGRENGLYDPGTLERIERAMRHTQTLEVDGRPINKAVSIVDVVKETHRALNENRVEYYVLPRNRQLIAQELLLFENSGCDDLEDFTDSQFRTARMTVRTPWVDALLYPDFLQQLRSDLAEILGDGLDFELTGGAPLFTRVFKSVTVSMARSYVCALAVITPMLVLLIGSLRRGLVGMIPNLIPVFMVLGLMGWADIPLDVSTLLIGAIVIGLAVDDTIHFMHKFNCYYEDTGSAVAAVRQTVVTTGSALLFTSLVLALGFGVFMFAYMRNAMWFGLLTSFATIVAFLADVLVGPALMVLVTPGIERERERARVRFEADAAWRAAS
jgi:predicted RND superfamily exporter protein